MYNLENNVEWTEELKTAFKKNTTYGSLIFHKEEEETLVGEEIVTGNNNKPSGKLSLQGNTKQIQTNGYQMIHQVNELYTSTRNGVAFESYPNGIYHVYGTASANTQFELNVNNGRLMNNSTSTYHSNLEIGDYTLSIETLFGNPKNISCRSGNTTLMAGTTDVGHFSLEEAITDFNIYGRIVTNETVNWIFKIMLEKGTESHEWEEYSDEKVSPSPEYIQPINIFKGSNTIYIENENKLKNITWTEGKYLNANNEEIENINWAYSDYVEIDEDDIYTSSCSGNAPKTIVYDENKNQIATINVRGNLINKSKIKLDTYQNAKYIRISTIKYYISETAIAKGQVKEITLPTSMEMCKIGNYVDEFIHQDNKWYKKKQIQKKILNGTENWSYASNLFLISSITNYKITSENICICTHYISQNCVTTTANVLDKHITFRNQDTTKRLYIKDSDFTSVTDFKTWLSNNNVTLYYVLATPVIEEITDSTFIEQLNGIDDVQLFKGINHISTITENQKPILNLEYTKLTDIEINESNYLKSIELKEHRYVPDTGFIGQAVAKMATINLTNEATEVFNLENAEFELKIGAKYNDNIYYINYGNFIVDSAPENDDTNGTIKLTAYDYMIKFNKPYQDTITYPCTLRALLLNICNQANIELMTNSFANENFEVENNQFEGKTLREVLQNIAKCAFTWARIRQDNKLYLDFEVSDTVVEEITINDYKQDNFKKANEYFGAINKVTYADNDIEGQEESVLDQGDIILHGIHELVIKNNYFAYTTAKKRELIQAGSVLFGLKYMPIQDLKMVGLIYLESNDIIKVYNVDETYITSIPFCHTINYQGYTSDEITAEGITDNQKEYENKNTSAESNSRAEFSVDRANKKIQSIVSQIGDRTEKTTTITQDIDGIELEVSEGLNVLDTIEKRGEIETEEAIDTQVYSIELKGTKEYVAYLHSGDGYSGDSYSNGGII